VNHIITAVIQTERWSVIKRTICARKIANVVPSTWLDVSISEVDVRRVAPTIQASLLVIIKYEVVVALMWIEGEQWHVLEESCGLC
jgi:hypothetical protein